MTTELQRVTKVVEWLIFEHIVENRRDLAEKMDYTESSLSQILNGKVPLSEKFIKKLAKTNDRINENWILTNNDKMLINNSDIQFYDPENAPASRKLIPFYDDVVSVGGINGMVANVDCVNTPTEYIDPGDWFKNATSAIRNYGESMKEYPPGCILVLKEVFDRRLIIPGKDYVIETSEYRVTKRAHASNHNSLHVRSTNCEKYEDGALIHPPFDILWECIDKISEVLAHIVKKGSGTEVQFSDNKK